MVIIILTLPNLTITNETSLDGSTVDTVALNLLVD
jgi:hypothetical protein